MKKASFTLAELVIVVAALTLLVALILPGRAAEAARRAACSDNLRKIGQTMAQYAKDCDDFVPGLYQAPAVTANAYRWNVALAKYGNDPRPFCCPDSKAYAANGAKLANYDCRKPGDTRNLLNYIGATTVGVNGFFGNMKMFKAFEYSGRKLSNILNAEKLAYAADVVGLDAKLYPHNLGQTVGSFFGPRVAPTRGASIAPRHQDNANILFTDGRVEARSRKELEAKCAAWSKAPNVSFFLVNR